MILKKWKKIVIIIIIIIISISVGAYAAYLINSTDVTYSKSDGNTISVKEALDDLYEKVPKYTRGQLVKLTNDPISTDEYYVLYERKDTLELFAKTNIDKTTCDRQVNESLTITKCNFSSLRYWDNDKNLNVMNRIFT